MPPEVLLTKNYELHYNPFVADVWSMGVLLYCMINRGYPFMDNDRMLDQQMAHKIRFSKKISFAPGPQLNDLLYHLLDPNVESRIKMPALMVHPWIATEVRQIEESTIDKDCGSSPTPSPKNKTSIARSRLLQPWSIKNKIFNVCNILLYWKDIAIVKTQTSGQPWVTVAHRLYYLERETAQKPDFGTSGFLPFSRLFLNRFWSNWFFLIVF